MDARSPLTQPIAAANRIPEGPSTAVRSITTNPIPEPCVICLCPITERAICNPCNHLAFDFLCLSSWLDSHGTCPLCKDAVRQVEYDWRSPTEYLTYHVSPAAESGRQRSTPVQSTPRYHHWNGPRAYPRRRVTTRPDPIVTQNAALARRRRVYELGAFSAYVGANRVSEYRHFTPAVFQTTASLQSRARIFIRRELSVFAFLESGGRQRSEFLLEYIVGMLKTLEIKGADGRMEDLVAEFLGRVTAKVFLHELEAWLRSPFLRLEDWDRAVQYREEELGYDKTRSRA